MLGASEPRVKAEVTTTIPLVGVGAQIRSIRGEIDAAVRGVLDGGSFILGDDVERFEREFAAYCQVGHVVGVDSGVSALEMGMRALGIGSGDEVIVPANSFIASSSAVSFTGAKPVFVDVDPTTYNIGPQLAEKSITSRTKAMMIVHLYGQPADVGELTSVAQANGLLIIEDAAQAHGARYRGQRVGSFGHVSAFSFYPTKNLGALGDAGALVTNDADIADRVRMMRNYGQSEKNRHEQLGWNRRLDTIQAAVLRVKLRHLDRWNSRRQELARLYNRLLAGQRVTTPLTRPDRDHVFHLYVIEVEDRDGLSVFLRERGVETGIHYPVPIHLQPAYAHLGYEEGAFPVTEKGAGRLLSLPMFPELSDQEVVYIVECIEEFLGRAGQG